jgi:glycosyltransferase involved in cell wall biosynthesis
MNNKLRLFVVEADGGGGLAHYIYQLCTALAKEGADVTLVTASDYELQELPHNFRVVRLLHLWKRFDVDVDQNANKWVNSLRKLYLKLRRAVRAIRWVVAWTRLTIFLLRAKPDLVQFSKMHFALESYFIGFLRSRGIKLAQICHEFEEREGQNRLEAYLLGVKGDVYSNFSAMFFHAKENRDRFFSLYSSIPEENAHIIPHGNSAWLLNFKPKAESIQRAREKYGLRDDDRVVLFFGLLAPSKGLDDLIEAFSIASKSCDARLLIAGYPTKHINMEDLINRISELKLTDRVTLDTRYIPVEEVGILMGLATVAVYPYRSSTQSGALQVAYTFGRPVIATAVGGLPEAVEDGKNGFLVPAQSPHDLAGRIVTLINEPELAEKMGDYARYLSETRFGWDSIARQILMVYQQLVADKE